MKRWIGKLAPLLILFLFILLIFRSWFVFKPLSAGDWPYLFAENIKEFSWWPKERVFWLTPYYQITAKIFVEYLGFSWELTERVFWFWPFLALSIFSSYYLTKSWLGSLIYTTNTYILMIVGGGQMGVAMSYALAPLVFAWLIRKKRPLIGGLLLGLQMMFDPRLTLINLAAVVGYYFFVFRLKALKKLITPFILALLINLFWILPLLRGDSIVLKELEEVYAAPGIVKYFSFASFSNTISLLHPNWPENIFGKVYFMKPEFLIIPLFVFAGLLWRPQKKKTLFFAGLALLAAFLAKGTQPPFGGVYGWLFAHLPGFVVFRDPTKFYLLIALAYSVLISRALANKRLLTLIFLLFWLFTIREAVMGQLGGTFQGREVPEEYIRLKDFLHHQPEFFRTFWLPQRQRFGFDSGNHPSLEGIELPSKAELQAHEIKYVIIPYDSEAEIFLEDRKYSSEKRRQIEEELNQVDFLEKMEIDKTERLTIYKMK